jgi:hypothetical protein
MAACPNFPHKVGTVRCCQHFITGYEWWMNRLVGVYSGVPKV